MINIIQEKKYLCIFLILLNSLIILYYNYKLELSFWQSGFRLQICISIIANGFFSILCVFFCRKKIFYLIKYFFFLVIINAIAEDDLFNVLVNLELIFTLTLTMKKNFGIVFSSITVILHFLYKTENVMGHIRTIDNTEKIFTAAISFLIIIIISVLKKIENIASQQHILLAQNQETISKLTDLALQAQKYAAEVEEESIHKERNRLIREIHDIMGYSLVNVSLMMEICTDYHHKNEYDAVAMQIDKVKTHVREAHEQVRYSLRNLRTYKKVLTGIQAYHNVIKTFKKTTGIEINVEYTNIKTNYKPEIDAFIVRFLQEGLINSFRHGKASKIDIMFFENVVGESWDLLIYITDNGMGAVDYKEGLGFIGMKERIASLNGKIHFLNLKNGFQIVATIPLLKENGGEDCGEFT